MVYARSGTGVLELVNLIGSAFYGPILAVFVMGAATRGVTGRGAVTGLVAGLIANLLVSQLLSGLSWLWWNPLGFVVAMTAAGIATPGPVNLVRPAWPRRETAWLAAAFVVILTALAAGPVLLGWIQAID